VIATGRRMDRLLRPDDAGRRHRLPIRQMDLRSASSLAGPRGDLPAEFAPPKMAGPIGGRDALAELVVALRQGVSTPFLMASWRPPEKAVNSSSPA